VPERQSARLQRRIIRVEPEEPFNPQLEHVDDGCFVEHGGDLRQGYV
jgi:hypothetical protein